jgi:hypothetical protein
LPDASDFIAAELDSINRRIAWLAAEVAAPSGAYSMLAQLRERAAFLESEIKQRPR